MYTDEKLNLRPAIQVELVDNWHPRWREVLDTIEFLGQRESLQIDSDGWLSARQILLVAFVDDMVAGHLSFRVSFSERASEGRVDHEIEGCIESTGAMPGFDGLEVETLLRAAAEKRARALRCTRLVQC